MHRYAETKQVLFVDAFDTIIQRVIHPFSVIDRWADFMACYFGIELSAPEISQIRRMAYQQLVALHDEPTYMQMMEELYKRLVIGRYLASNTDTDIFHRTALDTEIALEMKSHFLNQRMINFLAEQKEAGSAIYCIADYYLPRETLKLYLENLGVADLIDRIFVSCDYSASKRTGRLYKIVLSELGLSADAVAMIGNNISSDKAMAKEAGIKAIVIRNISYRLRNKIESFRRRCKLLRNPAWEHYRDLSRIDRRPFLAYALIYYAFTDRLYRKLKAARARSVVFLAREGLFLKKCFDQYQSENISPSQRIQSSYLKISRKASTGVMLKEIPDETFAAYIQISIRSFLESLPFNDQEVDGLLTLFSHLGVDRVISGFSESAELLEIRNNEEFHRLYNAVVLRNRTAFSRYIHDILGDESQMFLVDIGWHGKMQMNLHLFTSLPTAALYLGFSFDDCQPHGNTAEGLIFSNYPRLSPLYDILQSNRQFYEQLAAASHGAACSYALDENGAVVIREQWPEQERNLFEQTVQGYQEVFKTVFRQLSGDVRLSPRFHLDNAMLAKIVINCGLSTKRKDLEFARMLDSSFAGNFMQETKRIDYSDSSIRLDVKTLLLKPETYFKYAVKAPRVLQARGLQFGYILIHLYRAYLKVHLGVRGLL